MATIKLAKLVYLVASTHSPPVSGLLARNRRRKATLSGAQIRLLEVTLTAGTEVRALVQCHRLLSMHAIYKCGCDVIRNMAFVHAPL